MNHVAWKLCRVKNVHSAILASDLGAAFIGFHIPRVIRPSRCRRFKRISRSLAVRKSNCEPVVVTRIKKITDLVKLVQTCDAGVLQLHSSVDAKFLMRLHKRLGRRGKRINFIYVIEATAENVEEIIPSSDTPVVACIIDTSLVGGTGTQAPTASLKDKLSRISGVPRYVAGGLSVDNVRSVISKLQPDGVDVQSRLELSSRGRPKDGCKVLDFASLVHSENRSGFYHPKHPSVVLALTESIFSKSDKILNRFDSVDIDRIHFDYSDQSIAQDFRSYTIEFSRSLRKKIPALRYDVHIFSNRCESYVEIAESFLRANPLLRLVTFFVPNGSWINSQFFDAVEQVRYRHGIALGFSLHSPGFSSHALGQALEKISRTRPSEISLITHSDSHLLHLAAIKDRSHVSEICAKTKNLHPCFVSLDRDMTPEKLSLVGMPGVTGVIVGHHLLTQPRPQRTVDTFRRLLTAWQ